MRVDEVLVHELRDEHKDREWVDRWGTHLAWCEDTWMYRYPNIMDAMDWEPLELNTEGGPFMNALHYRLIWGNR